MRRLSVWIDLIGMGQALAGHGPASGPASGARKRSGRTLQRPRPWWSSRNACEQFSAEMLESGQFPSRARSRAHSGVRRSPLVHWRLLTRLLHSPVVVWSWFCDIKITIPPPTVGGCSCCSLHCVYGTRQHGSRVGSRLSDTHTRHTRIRGTHTVRLLVRIAVCTLGCARCTYIHCTHERASQQAAPFMLKRSQGSHGNTVCSPCPRNSS